MQKLTEAQRDIFQSEGAVVVEDVLTDDDLGPVIDEIAEFVNRRTLELKADGRIDDPCEGSPFERRYGELYAQCRDVRRGIDIMIQRGPAAFAFLHNENLLDLVEDFIGSEITCNPIQHIRAKVPRKVAMDEPDIVHNVPWHQDAGVTWEEADLTEIITFWIPLVDATEENGCLQIMPGAFQQGYMSHHRDGDSTIVPDQLPDISPKPMPCRKGGMVVMTKYTPHRSCSNRSVGVRWSMDLRYQRTGEPTGRPFWPAFAVRSRHRSESILTDYDEWCRRWVEALENSKGVEWHRLK